ncbi:MAG TPA: pyridoxamine 5'-phosphate oxidase family protein [Microlunatus sp.]|nr:pyridoxamine 5'-phosphate oxidase family protein [Microlunatus sp.]
MAASSSSPRRFSSLPATECLARLRSHTVGRVGWNTMDGPQILPVSFVLRDESIIFRTSPYGALSELRNVRQVAFEVDEFDVTTRTGWSVLVRGWAKAATNPDDLSSLWEQQDPIPWATGARTLFITVSIDQVSGRVISG